MNCFLLTSAWFVLGMVGVYLGNRHDKKRGVRHIPASAFLAMGGCFVFVAVIAFVIINDDPRPSEEANG